MIKYLIVSYETHQELDKLFQLVPARWDSKYQSDTIIKSILTEDEPTIEQESCVVCLYEGGLWRVKLTLHSTIHALLAPKHITST